MQILLFSDVNGTLGFGRYAGVYRLATELRSHGFSTQVVDFYSRWNLQQWQQIIDRYVGKETLLVGLTTTLIVKSSSNQLNIKKSRALVEADTDPFPWSDEFREELFSMIRKKNPQVKIVAGGARAESARHLNSVDFCITGEAETVLLDLTRGLSENRSAPKPKVIDGFQSPFSHFNSSRIIWERNDFLFEGEHLPIEISRGCRYRCAFCSFNLNGKNPTDYVKDVKSLKQELIKNHENHGTTGYMFCDDTFNDSPDKVESVCNVLASLPFKLEWVTYARLDMMRRHPEMAIQMQQAGLRSVYFGFESFNGESLRAIGKGLDRPRSYQTLHNLKELWGNNVIISGSFIVGLPFESVSSIRETMDWIEKDDCPIDFPILIPLRIRRKKGPGANNSLFGLNPEKYGYTIHENGRWENEFMTSDFANELVEARDHENLLRKRKVASFSFYSRLRNLGYSENEVLEMNWDSLTSDIDQRIGSMKSEYFERLME